MSDFKLCDKDCNNCDLIRSENTRMLNYIFEKLNEELGNDVYKIVNGACPNLTVCFDCRIDDFCHVEGCEIIKKLDSEQRWSIIFNLAVQQLEWIVMEFEKFKLKKIVTIYECGHETEMYEHDKACSNSVCDRCGKPYKETKEVVQEI